MSLDKRELYFACKDRPSIGGLPAVPKREAAKWAKVYFETMHWAAQDALVNLEEAERERIVFYMARATIADYLEYACVPNDGRVWGRVDEFCHWASLYFERFVQQKKTATVATEVV